MTPPDIPRPPSATYGGAPDPTDERLPAAYSDAPMHRTSVPFWPAPGNQLCYADATAGFAGARVVAVELEPTPSLLIARTPVPASAWSYRCWSSSPVLTRLGD